MLGHIYVFIAKLLLLEKHTAKHKSVYMPSHIAAFMLIGHK